MDDLEERRIRDLTSIVGAEAVEAYSFYDDVDYCALTVNVYIVAAGDLTPTIREVRRLADISLRDARDALMGRSILFSTSHPDLPGRLEQRLAVTKSEKLKRAVEAHGGKVRIALRSADGDFERADCCSQELHYLKTRIVTWM